MYSSNKPDLVEVVRDAYRGLRLQRGADDANRAAVGNFVARLEPSLVYSIAGEATPQIHRGRGQVESLLHDAAQSWESCEFELDHVERVGCGRVAVTGACRAQLPSGHDTRFEFSAIWTFRGERARRIDAFPGRDPGSV